MLPKDQEITYLEEYWAGTLPGPERAFIEKKLDTDPEFRKEAEEWKEIYEQAFQTSPEEIKQRKILKEQLLKLEENYLAKEKTFPLWIWRSGMASYLGASVAIILLFIVIFVGLNKGNEIDELIQVLPMDNETYSSDGKTAGEKAYKTGDYEEAMQALVQEINTPEDSINFLYAGISALLIDEEEKAIEYLQHVSESEDWEDYRPESDWYMALAYAKSGNPEDAKNILDKILAEGDSHFHYEDALNLLELLANKN